jgi:hypothetical protein
LKLSNKARNEKKKTYTKFDLAKQQTIHRFERFVRIIDAAVHTPILVPTEFMML